MQDISKKSQATHPIVCEIRARGEIDETWSSRFRGMRVTVDRVDPSAPVTILRGSLPDDAAVNGVLTTLYSLGLSLLSVLSTTDSESPADVSRPARR